MNNVQSTLPLLSQRRINRLKASLEQRNLLVVMDEVLPHVTLEFEQSRLSGRWALRAPLGHRNQSDGTTVAVWAYIFDDHTGSEPPIVFRDEVPTHSKGATTMRLYPRAASSLLRKACQLRPPFCFLQQERDEVVRDGRGMLCAVVAYYGLMAGSSDCAMRWPRFDTCLTAALDYINTTVGGSAAKQAVQHEKTSKIAEWKASMALPNAAPKRKVSNAVAMNDMIPEVAGHAALPTNFADRYHQHNESLIVRLKLGRQALVKIAGFSQPFDLPGNRDEAIGVVANLCNSGLDDDVNSVIGDDVDSVIGDISDGAFEMAGQSGVCDNDRATHCRTKSKKRKLVPIAKDSDDEGCKDADGHEWRQAFRNRRYKG